MCRIKSVLSSISSTLHHATTAHTHKKSPSPQHYIMPTLHIHTRNLHLLNTTSCHYCTYTQEISISSTLHVLSSVPVNFTRCLWTISSECEGLAGGGGEEAAYMWARENTQATMTWEKRDAHNNTCIQEHTCISTATLHVSAQPLYTY